LLGLIFGSFVNAWVWRLHETEELEGRKGKSVEKRRKALSLPKGRSMCTDCGHELAAKDLVPVLSWVWLRGKCRYCGKSISWQYPVVELITAGLFVWSYLAWPMAVQGVGVFQLVVWLACVVAFMALAIYDLRWFLLPDRIVFPLIALVGTETIVSYIWRHDQAHLWEPVVGATVISGLFWLLWRISDGKWIGFGDVKLAIVLGLLVGSPARAFLVIFVASLLGTLVSIPLLLKGRAGLKLHIPFGPYLLGATILVVLYGAHIIDWYTSLLLR
jgi:prepilin signal peptidase PulO-like enzyme (type II secretory pathway)